MVPMKKFCFYPPMLLWQSDSVKKAVIAPLPLSNRHRSERGSVRTIVLVLVCFCVGAATSALWLHRPAKITNETPELVLSQSTRTLLEHLNAPVELHFYSLLDPDSPAALRDYSGRVQQLLKAYELTAAGKIVVSKPANADPESALAEGIRGFDLDKGQGCYLGLAVSCAGKKEVLPQLYPAWEAALEPDVSRAIERVSAKSIPQTTTIAKDPTYAGAIEQLKILIPNFDSISLEEALQVSRTQSIEALSSATVPMNSLVKEAQEELLKAQTQGSAADRDAAAKKLQTIQARESQVVKEIAGQSQARIELIKKLKSAGN
jgi:hypothetical protein